jgi:hypothetical protein
MTIVMNSVKPNDVRMELMAIEPVSTVLINDEKKIHPIISFTIAEVKIIIPKSEWNILTSSSIVAITGNAVIAVTIAKKRDVGSDLYVPEKAGIYHDTTKPAIHGISMENKLTAAIDLPCLKIDDSSTSMPTFTIINIKPKNTIPLKYPVEGNSQVKKLGARWPKKVGPSRIPAIICPITAGILKRVKNSLKTLATVSMMLIETSNVNISFEDICIVIPQYFELYSNYI